MADATENEIEAELKDRVKTTKRGFDLQARLKGRGLRRGSITLFLDEEKGPELGWAFDRTDPLGNVVGREREGVLGKIDEIEASAGTKADKAKALEPLQKQRDALIEELTKTAIVIHLRAVPPVIQKDCRRKAKQTLEITTKDIPDALLEEYNLSFSAHLMALMLQSITDNESGETNTEITYEDAVDLMGYLPPGQWQRLDELMGKVQFTDAISLSIEGQEDFS